MKIDEADEVRNDEIADLRRQRNLLLAILFIAALAGVLGGPGAVSALQAAQSFVGVAP